MQGQRRSQPPEGAPRPWLRLRPRHGLGAPHLRPSGVQATNRFPLLNYEHHGAPKDIMSAPSVQPSIARRRKQTQAAQPWKQTGCDGWLLRRGKGLIAWHYIAPDGEEFTDEQEALAHARGEKLPPKRLSATFKRTPAAAATAAAAAAAAAAAPRSSSRQKKATERLNPDQDAIYVAKVLGEPTTIVEIGESGDCFYEAIVAAFENSGGETMLERLDPQFASAITPVLALRSLVAADVDDAQLETFKICYKAGCEDYAFVKGVTSVPELQALLKKCGQEFGLSSCVWANEYEISRVAAGLRINILILDQGRNPYITIRPPSGAAVDEYVILQRARSRHYNLILVDSFGLNTLAQLKLNKQEGCKRIVRGWSL